MTGNLTCNFSTRTWLACVTSPVYSRRLKTFRKRRRGLAVEKKFVSLCTRGPYSQTFTPELVAYSSSDDSLSADCSPPLLTLFRFCLSAHLRSCLLLCFSAAIASSIALRLAKSAWISLRSGTRPWSHGCAMTYSSDSRFFRLSKVIFSNKSLNSSDRQSFPSGNPWACSFQNMSGLLAARILYSVSVILASSKHGLYATMTKRTTADANMSTPSPVYDFFKCSSGAMYDRVPHTVFRRPEPSSPTIEPQSPKSATLRSHWSSRRRFSGFKSLWVMP